MFSFVPIIWGGGGCGSTNFYHIRSLENCRKLVHVHLWIQTLQPNNSGLLRRGGQLQAWDQNTLLRNQNLQPNIQPLLQWGGQQAWDQTSLLWNQNLQHILRALLWWGGQKARDQTSLLRNQKRQSNVQQKPAFCNTTQAMPMKRQHPRFSAQNRCFSAVLKNAQVQL